MAKISELSDDHLARQISKFKKLVKEGDDAKKPILKALLQEKAQRETPKVKAEVEEPVSPQPKQKNKADVSTGLKKKNSGPKKSSSSSKRKASSSPRGKRAPAKKPSSALPVILLVLLLLGGGGYGLLHFGIIGQGGDVVQGGGILAQLTNVALASGLEGTYVHPDDPSDVIVIKKKADGSYSGEAFKGEGEVTFYGVDEHTLGAFDGMFLIKFENNALSFGGTTYKKSNDLDRMTYTQLVEVPNELKNSTLVAKGKNGGQVEAQVDFSEGKLVLKTGGFDQGELTYYDGLYLLDLQKIDLLESYNKKHFTFQGGKLVSKDGDGLTLTVKM